MSLIILSLLCIVTPNAHAVNGADMRRMQESGEIPAGTGNGQPRRDSRSKQGVEEVAVCRNDMDCKLGQFCRIEPYKQKGLCLTR